jgi:hypothetical protein
LNIATVLVLMQLLTSPDVGWRSLVPGAVFGGVGYFALQQLGGYLVDRYLTGSSDVYGTFAVVIGLLSWFHLLGQLTMLAAEINVVSSRRLYPRRLLGDTMSDGDRRAYEGYLAAQVRDPRVRAAPLPDADGRAPTPQDNDERPGGAHPDPARQRRAAGGEGAHHAGWRRARAHHAGWRRARANHAGWRGDR